MQRKLDACGSLFTREIPSTIRYVIPPLERHERLLTEAELQRFDADAAVRLLIEASQSALEGGDVEAGLRAARSAVALADEAHGTTLALARIALAAPLMLSGNAAEASALLEGWLDEPPLDELFDGAFRAATLLFWLERYDAAAELLERLVAVARESGRLDRLARPLDTLASLDYRLGRWRRAEARSREALRVARLGAQPFEIGSALTTQARVSAARGDEDACHTLLDAARAAAPDDALVGGYAATAEALLHLSCDRPELALTLLEPLPATPLAQHEPTVFLWEPDLIEAYVRAGRRDDAQLLLVDFENRAASTGRRWALAAAARCRGLLAPAEEVDQHFGLALDFHREVPMPFERARTELSYGVRLRRCNRMSDARTHLRSALTTFQLLQANAWVERTRRELVRRKARTEGVPLETRLTPHELQVALL